MSVLADILADAGIVGPLLALCALILFWSVGTRWYTLRAPGNITPDALLAGEADGTLLGEAVHAARRASLSTGQRVRARLEAEVRPYRHAFTVHRSLLRSVVAVAPLAGLLGTVTGMIATFDALGTGAVTAIGAGISEAMVSTEVGLVVAVPGLLLGAIFERRQTLLEGALDGLVDRLVATGGA